MGDDLTAWICATCANEDLSRPQCDNCKSDVAYEATITLQAEEVARLTAERDETDKELALALRNLDRTTTERDAARKALSDVAAVAEQIANDGRWDGGRRATASLVLHTMQNVNSGPYGCGRCDSALAKLARMTERHAGLRAFAELMASDVSGWPGKAADAVLAVDDAAAAVKP